MAEPVSPPVVLVPSILGLARALGIDEAVVAGAVDVELPDGLGLRVIEDHDVDERRNFVSFCTGDVNDAAATIDGIYDGQRSVQSFTTDPETMRLRSVVLSTPTLIVTAVRCLSALDCGVPCHEECSPLRRLRT